MKKLTIIFPLLAVMAFAFMHCGKKTEVQQIVLEPVEKFCGANDGSRPGDFRELSCDPGFEGKKLEVCNDRGEWVIAQDSCVKSSCEPGGGDLVTFADIKPILDSKCVECHYTPENITNYDIASKWADDIHRRIKLPTDNIQFMPFQRPPLEADEIDLIRKWIDDGKPEADECPVEEAFIDLDYIESEILAYLNTIDNQDRRFVRFLVGSHKYNLGLGMGDSAKAMDKTLNSLSFDNQIHNCRFIDQKKTVCAFDFRTFNQEARDWDIVETSDPVGFISRTSKAALIRDLTGTQQPWFHYDVYIDIALGNPLVYYDIMDVPETYAEFQAQFGINVLQKLIDHEGVFAGFNGSPISLRKNRLIYRFDSQINGFDGACWSTADPENVVAQANIFEFPFLNLIQGSVNTFEFAAGETICHLPNNMFIYALFNAAGARQDFAPVTVVTDIEGLDPQIDNPIDCFRCHNAGFIPARDEVRNIALRNAKFDQVEKDAIRQIYKKNNELSAYFQRDNKQFSKGLNAIGVQLGEPDPVNKSYDFYRQDQSLKQVAAFLFLPVNDMINCIEESVEVKNQIGQLLNGAKITHDQLILTLPTLFRECNDILNDPLGT